MCVKQSHSLGELRIEVHERNPFCAYYGFRSNDTFHGLPDQIQQVFSNGDIGAYKPDSGCFGDFQIEKTQYGTCLPLGFLWSVVGLCDGSSDSGGCFLIYL